MIETFKEFTFEAAHQLPPYSGLHGHSFKVAVVMTGEPDPVFGWAANLYEVEQGIDDIRRDLDHRYLNEVEGLSNPSLENIAQWIWRRLENRVAGIDRVVVKRGPDGQAEGCTFSARAAA